MKDCLQRRLTAVTAISSLSLLTLSLLTLSLSTQVAAAGIDEIIVTAQKREQSIRDVPISMVALQGDDLISQQITGMEQLADSLPNVYISTGTVSNNIYMRGVGSGSNGGFEQAVATFVDGAYRGRSRYTASSLVDVERVEVLRGPQTLYFGNNAIGGAFSVTTRNPSLEAWEGYGMTSYEFEGSEPMVEVATGGPLVEDTFGIRIAARYSDLDGYIENKGSGNDNPAIEDTFVRLTSLWQINSDWNAMLKVENGKQSGEGVYPAQLHECPPDAPFSAAASLACGTALALGIESDLDFTRTTNPGEFSDVEAEEYVLKIERDNAEGFGFVAQATYSELDYNIGFDTDTVNLNFVTTSLPEDLEQTTFELRLLSPADSKLEYMFGLYYLKSDSNIDTNFNLPFVSADFLNGIGLGVLGPFTPFSVSLDLDQEEEAFSAFGSVTWPFTEKLSGTLGVRYTKSEKDGLHTGTNATYDPVTDQFAQYGTPIPDALQPLAALLTGLTPHSTRASVNDSDVLPSAILNYEYGDNVSLYAKYTEGFKAGGFDTSELTGLEERTAYGPETVRAYEVGMKSLWLDNSLSFNLALFRSDYEDLQQAVTSFTATAAFISITNVGGLISQGVEAEVVWQANDYWRFSSSLSGLDAYYEDYDEAGCTVAQAAASTGVCVQSVTDEMPPYASDFSGNIGVNFTYPVNSSLVFEADLGMRFMGEYDLSVDRDANIRQDAWQKYDLRLGLSNTDSTWEIAVIGKNLSDEVVMSDGDDVVASPGSYFVVVERGRTIALQARYNW